jgi:hypothetical protein
MSFPEKQSIDEFKTKKKRKLIDIKRMIIFVVFSSNISDIRLSCLIVEKRCECVCARLCAYVSKYASSSIIKILSNGYVMLE